MDRNPAQPQKNLGAWRLGAVLALIITLVLNTLAGATSLLGGRTTGEISNGYPVVFTPANYVFGIWGLIYLGLIAFTVYQALPGGARNPRIGPVLPLFVLSCAFNSAWILAWQYRWVDLSMGFMLGLLLTLIALYRRLEIGLRPTRGADSWLVNAPFSLYLGWISVATIANAVVTLYQAGFTAGGVGWTVVLIAVATALGLAFLRARGDVLYALVLIWALGGIAVRNWGIPVVAVAALLGIGLLILGIGGRPGRRLQALSQP
ncbi:tryptophan-rich sensory protein [Meiothermus granaticius]|uniref:tryptophan-rich sensory protein n=1 Tax=Meiothermus granaticius TaxID=863370 RepID=UPI0011BDB32D|nr:tryptophan-rich sensory protein [Meiothermus granaticius]